MAKNQEVAGPKVASPKVPDQKAPDQEVAVKHKLQIARQFNQIRMKLQPDPNAMSTFAQETVMKGFTQRIRWR